jgi:hypothetical protein
MIKILKTGIFLMAFLSMFGCKKELEDYYYADTEEYVDMEMLALLSQNEDYSSYLSILSAYQIDTIFEKGRSLTFFVPTNEAIESMAELYLDTIDYIKYLITDSYINIAQIQGNQNIQTSGGKFAFIQNSGGTGYFDAAEITLSGPLCKNGKFYEISGGVQPLPNLYEYIGLTNPFFEAYIDSQDSTYLDLELSTPIGYDPDGNTIYDTVLTTLNVFEEEIFPVSEEFRTKKATMLLFSQEQFDNALEIIVDDLGLPSSESIPFQWKNEVLMPYLVDQGVFWNDLGYEDFASGRIRNIKGDSVDVDPDNIDFLSSFRSSNGRSYNYLDFIVPDSLYKGVNIMEGEHLVLSKGNNLFAWNTGVIVTGPPVTPMGQLTPNIARNDSTLLVRFDGANYSDEFSMTFSFINIFPGRYRLLCRAKTSPSGVFQILVNGELQDIDLGYGPSDRVDLYDLREPVRSFTKEVFRPESGFNSFDILVENINEYGNVNITLRYVEPGQKSENGFVIDYFLLESYSE